MKFGTRLTLFITVTLLVIELSTAFAIRVLLHDTLVEDGKTQVAVAEARFGRQLSDLGQTMAEGVRLLTLDFALRRSIADHDAATVVSVLENHSRRIGAIRMVLIETDGMISGDTAAVEHGQAFPYPALLTRAAEDGSATTVAVIDDKPVWFVLVPVMAPDPIAFIAAALPLDDARLSRMRDIAGLSGHLGVAIGGPGAWRKVAGTIGAGAASDRSWADATPTIVDNDGEETIVFTRILQTPPDSPGVMAVIGYPLSDVMRRYQRVLYVLLPALILGLAGALVGAATIARGVSRPLEILAQYTKRIAAGDYRPPPPLQRSDELGQLSAALHDMAGAISERELRIRHQATHDPVTGLANRDALTTAIAGQVPVMAGSVLVIGITRWRETTNTVGRDVGDRLLRASAVRMRAQFPPGTPIGTIGESSFGVFLKNADHAAATAEARKVIGAFDIPYQERELAIDAAVAVGVSAAPEHGTDAAQLLRRAEVALLAALTSEPRIAFYRPEADPHRPERLSLMSDLRRGIGQGEFELVYQPKLDIRTGVIAGAEALVRWNHPSRGSVQPDDFIALAEETGNIQQLTRWVLRAGLTEAKRWHGLDHMLRIAINVSVRDLADASLPTRVVELLRETGLPARSLVLEVTESAIMGEPDAAIAILRRLADQGIDLAIDDFGVGQSSLAYLRRLPVREIKLDKGFVLKLAQNPDDQTIVRSVIDLGHGLGYRVTAEGVEDVTSLDLLRQYGCDYAQGYFVARPLSAQAFQSFVSLRRESEPGVAETVK